MEYIIESGKHALKSQQKQGRMVHMKNNAIKTAVALTLAVGTLATCACASAASTAATNVSETQIPDAPALVKGSAIDTQFSRECYLTSRNGADLLFWVKNNGTADISIAVNGEDPKILSPGQEGQVSVPLTYFTKSYLCQVSPVSEGDWLHIQYRISQERTSS